MQQIDFLPAAYHKRLHKRRLRVRKTWASVLLLGLIAAWTVSELYLLEKKSHTVVQLKQRVEIEALAVAQRRLLSARKQQLDQKIQLEKELRLPVKHSLIGSTLIQTLPPSVALTRLEIVHQSPEPEHAKRTTTASHQKPKAAPQKVLQQTNSLTVYVEGFGPSDQLIQDFVAGLQDIPLFNDVVFRSSRNEEIGGLQVRAFNLVVTIDLNRDFIYDNQEVAHVD